MGVKLCLNPAPKKVRYARWLNAEHAMEKVKSNADTAEALALSHPRKVWTFQAEFRPWRMQFTTLYWVPMTAEIATATKLSTVRIAKEAAKSTPKTINKEPRGVLHSASFCYPRLSSTDL
ncbi:hypothetical protein A2841_02020 [Candidatus Kaiserbacteria bacterium RIFCSPHIGHO2_01_FULL_48_10]|uniref:Uncharacterized protein n=1 Tax=Candidatus Kaiserbacteria bacterium RIFCSPHIGHO2_01_FULL_48_10 TaxID=1798476 RepID=A0A1F6C6G4_9BACT|nr:MAG: hypothetical protein A2841_02020 [Candidatus Kaiserbacteria bacterium RIFCSPHIGHO2_01_FULL_48_10]